MNRAAWIVMVLLATLIAFSVGVEAGNGPPCRTEDSCTIVYRHGRWHIERATP